MIKITKIEYLQVNALKEIAEQTFRETFAPYNSAIDMNNYLSDSFNEARLLIELQNKNCEYFLAFSDEKAVGYLKVNFLEAQTELKDSESMEIERIYVLQDFHGAKVGKALLEKSLSIAREKRLKFVWLGVWEKNERAINFYRKAGFLEFDKHIFKLGHDEQTDIMMKMKL